MHIIFIDSENYNKSYCVIVKLLYQHEFMFSRYADLYRQYVSEQNGFWICMICKQTFSNHLEFKNHTFSEFLHRFICCKCNSKFVDEKTFKIHARDHKRQTINLNLRLSQNRIDPSGKLIDDRINNTFICKYCDAPFKDRSDFYNHYMDHTSRTRRSNYKKRERKFT